MGDVDERMNKINNRLDSFSNWFIKNKEFE